MIGTEGEGQPSTSTALLRLPNIHLLGTKDYNLLPDYLRGLDLAVQPYRLNDYTSSIFPMKFFEYLAAGKTVISTVLPALKEFSDLYLPAKDKKEFIEAVEKALNGNTPDKTKCLETAKRHTWEKRLDWMEGLMKKKWEELEKSA
jgi:glycosyltransferase involved in cell wall biosynthesis